MFANWYMKIILQLDFQSLIRIYVQKVNNETCMAPIKISIQLIF